MNDDWKLEIVGPIDPSFNSYIDNYFLQNPRLKGRVKFQDAITNREALWQYYAKAKIFVLPSRWEGFALVYLEAAKAGCYIVSTDISAAYEITDNGRLGSIFPVNDSKKLSQILQEVTVNPGRLRDVCSAIQKYAYDKFYWPTLCKKIDSFLN